MANDAVPHKIVRVSELKDTTVNITSDHKLQVEFRIDDLITKLMPGVVADENCGGCNGCSGCSM